MVDDWTQQTASRPVNDQATATPLTDLAFDLHGETLASGYRLGLWNALLLQLPWLADEPGAGVHPLRVPVSNDPLLLLPRRLKLVLRVPVASVKDAAALAGQTLDVDRDRLLVGAFRERPLYPHPTVHASFVVAENDDEAAFHRRIASLLTATGAPPHHICGRMKSIAIGDARLHGGSVVLHGLKPAHSLYWQQIGLGVERRYGCGIMVPHKIITGLDD